MTALEARPQLVLVMGVAGSGKTTVGRELAASLGYAFIDADAFHSSEAIAQMRSGAALTPGGRDAWVERLLAELALRYQQRTSCVLAFSGLRAIHRRRLMQTEFATTAFMLHGSASLLAARLAARREHFMPATQLADQLATMEPVAAEEAIVTVNIEALPGNLVTLLLNELGTTGRKTP